MRNTNRFSGTARLIRLAAVIAMLPIAVGGFASEAVAGGECAEEDFFGCIECHEGLSCSWREGGGGGSFGGGGEGWCYGTQECRDCPTNPEKEATYCVLEDS